MSKKTLKPFIIVIKAIEDPEKTMGQIMPFDIETRVYAENKESAANIAISLFSIENPRDPITGVFIK